MRGLTPTAHACTGLGCVDSGPEHSSHSALGSIIKAAAQQESFSHKSNVKVRVEVGEAGTLRVSCSPDQRRSCEGEGRSLAAPQEPGRFLGGAMEIQAVSCRFAGHCRSRALTF